MHIPYIGITDFTTFEQVARMLDVFKAHVRPGQNRQLHVGVMMSYKTLHDRSTKWASVFPCKGKISGIFSSKEVMNCLHYADYESIDIESSLCEALSYGGKNINALQLDMIWPDPSAVARAVQASGKRLEVILQIGADAFTCVHNDPRGVVERLQTYKGIVDRVLLDKSMGHGIGMHAVSLLPFAQAITEHFPEIGIGAAGGLGPDSLHLAMPLLREFPKMSIDAQGKLRPSGNALEPIDWNMAGTYLRKALALVH